MAHDKGLLLGVDSGLTVTKAAVYSADGRELGVSSVPVPHVSQKAHWVERDMATLLDKTDQVIRGALHDAGVPGSDIAAVGTTGHGDGIYLVDSDGRPVRPGILSMDSRAIGLLEELAASGLLQRVEPIMGAIPFPGSSGAVVAWLAANEPDAIERTRHILLCKDWVKLGLTGEVSTDPTDGSAMFPDVHAQRYSREALEILGLEQISDKLPPIVPSTRIAGRITRSASSRTGLTAGTPVVSGIWDVAGCAIATGATERHQVSVVAGSFSINTALDDRPLIDPRWLCRSSSEPGRWLHCSASPASATNFEWFLSELLELPGSERFMTRPELFELCNSEVRAALDRPREVFYLPFLYGSPIDSAASAAIVGLRGWHTRGDVIRALFEGVVFNHLWHVQALQSSFELREARLAGGGSRSETWSQLFADALGLPVIVTTADETGALGAALCAAIGLGRYDSIKQAVSDVVHVRRTYEPDVIRHADLKEAFERYKALAAALTPYWRTESVREGYTDRRGQCRTRRINLTKKGFRGTKRRLLPRAD